MRPTWGVVPRKLPTVINVCKVRRADPKDPTTASLSEFGFETYLSYKNGLPYPVTVSLRNGMTFEVPPLNSNWRNATDFTVLVKYRFARNVKIDVHRLLDDVDDNASQMLIALRDAVAEARLNVVNNGNECVISHHVNREAFEKNGGCVYVDDLDITVSMPEHALNVIHPESPEGRMLKARLEASQYGFSYRIEINDPNRLYGDRFINISGRVFRIRATTDETKPEGVYVHSTGSVDDEPLLDGREHMPFESADDALGLYATAHDAKTLGNLAEERKREIEELQYTHKVQFMNMEHEFKRLTHDMETRMVEYKRERGEREMELATEVSRLKLVEMRLEQEAKEREARYATEKAERESRMLRDKEYYERRSYDRKDSSEIVKWVPAMVLGAGVLLSKFF